jgi:copper(I)-binding protein
MKSPVSPPERHHRWLPAASLLLGLLLTNVACATEAEHIRASQAWLRVLPGDLPAGAYVTLENSSNQPATLKSANSPAFAEVMLHQSSGNGGMSRMTMVDSLIVPAHGKLMLAPAGYHLMLTKAVHPVKPGDTVTLNLTFVDGSRLGTKFVARPANAIDASH